jgi:hypothetical protein
MSDPARERVNAWIVALASGVGGVLVAQGFTLTAPSPVEARLPAVEQSVRELDAIASVRAENLRDRVREIPATRKTRETPRTAPPASPAPIQQPVFTTRATTDIRIQRAEQRVLLENNWGSGVDYYCSWRFEATNYGKQPFSRNATVAFVTPAGEVVTTTLATVSLEPGETRTFRNTTRYEERMFHQIARVEVSFQ